jgi:hypothetical protein
MDHYWRKEEPSYSPTSIAVVMPDEVRRVTKRDLFIETSGSYEATSIARRPD